MRAQAAAAVSVLIQTLLPLVNVPPLNIAFACLLLYAQAQMELPTILPPVFVAMQDVHQPADFTAHLPSACVLLDHPATTPMVWSLTLDQDASADQQYAIQLMDLYAIPKLEAVHVENMMLDLTVTQKTPIMRLALG